jgi:hypothetical protein
MLERPSKDISDVEFSTLQSIDITVRFELVKLESHNFRFLVRQDVSE